MGVDEGHESERGGGDKGMSTGHAAQARATGGQDGRRWWWQGERQRGGRAETEFTSTPTPAFLPIEIPGSCLFRFLYHALGTCSRPPIACPSAGKLCHPLGRPCAANPVSLGCFNLSLQTAAATSTPPIPTQLDTHDSSVEAPDRPSVHLPTRSPTTPTHSTR